MSVDLPDLDVAPSRRWVPWAVAGAVLAVVDLVGLLVAVAVTS